MARPLGPTPGRPIDPGFIRPRFGGPKNGRPIGTSTRVRRPPYGGPQTGRPVVPGGRKPLPAPQPSGAQYTRGLDPNLHAALVQRGILKGYM